MKVSTHLKYKKTQCVFHGVQKSAIDSIQALPVLQKLDAELEKAVNALANANAPGNDANPLKLSNKVKSPPRASATLLVGTSRFERCKDCDAVKK